MRLIKFVILLAMVGATIFNVASFDQLGPYEKGLIAGLGLLLLTAVVFLIGAIFASWLIRLGGNIANEAARWAGGPKQAETNLVREAIKTLGDRSEPPALPAPSGYPAQFPMIEEAQFTEIQDDEPMA